MSVNFKLLVFLVVLVQTFLVFNTELNAQEHAVIDHRTTKLSNVDMFMSSNGVFGQDVKLGIGGGFWPRGSDHQYIFGGGFWFGAQKEVDGEIKTIVEIAYNPNSGQSWMIPGRIENGDKHIPDPDRKYRLYSSTEFGKKSGEPYDSDLANWPIWRTNKAADKSAVYIDEVSRRNMSSYPGGPVFLSDEDIFCTYKDSDLDYFEKKDVNRAEEGCPLGLQFEQTLYSWNELDIKNSVVIMYNIINTSDDILNNCWFATVADADVAIKTSSYKGASNDRVRYYHEDSGKNMVVFWSDTDYGEDDFGYMGFSYIMSPAVDEQGFVLGNHVISDPSNQLGLVTFHDWQIMEDVKETAHRYNFISSGVIDSGGVRGDRRIMISTGPFNMRPGDTTKVALLINFALPSGGGTHDPNDKIRTADSTELTALINNANQATEKFYTDIMTPVSVEETINYSGNNIISKTFPNPATDYISVEFNLKTPTFPKFEIINILGETVAKINKAFAAGTNRINIDTKSLASGSYYLKITAGSSQEINLISIVR